MIILRQKYFSSQLEDREYSIVGDLIKYRKSGAKRVIKKNIGEARRKLADKALEKNRENIAKQREALINSNATDRVLLDYIPGTKEEYNKLKSHLKHKKNVAIFDKTGSKIKNRVIDESAGFTYSDPKGVVNNIEESVKDAKKRLGGNRKAERRIKSNKSNKGYLQLVKYGKDKDGIIVLGKNSKTPSTLAHEWGHNKNRITNNREQRRREKFGRKDGSILDKIRGSRAVLNEEVKASKNGLKEMESVLGRKATDLEKESLNAAADTYKYSGRGETWAKIADMINIPSRKSTAGTSFAGSTRKEQLSMPEGKTGIWIQRKVLGRAREPYKIFPKVDYKPTKFIK